MQYGCTAINLKLYCDGSGQKINLDKSMIFFRGKRELAMKNGVMAWLGMHNEALRETYLGMPTDVVRASIGTFGFLLGKAWKHMNIWPDRPLSHLRKEALLKTVI
jgi:hypothetical protein